MHEDCNCVMSKDGETCITHNCNAHNHCMKEGCPHCDVPQNKYHDKMKFTDSCLKEKDRGDHE